MLSVASRNLLLTQAGSRRANRLRFRCNPGKHSPPPRGTPGSGDGPVAFAWARCDPREHGVPVRGEVRTTVGYGRQGTDDDQSRDEEGRVDPFAGERVAGMRLNARWRPAIAVPGHPPGSPEARRKAIHGAPWTPDSMGRERRRASARRRCGTEPENLPGRSGTNPGSPVQWSTQRGVVVQSVRMLACHAGGRGFESRPLRQLSRKARESGLSAFPGTAAHGRG